VAAVRSPPDRHSAPLGREAAPGPFVWPVCLAPRGGSEFGGGLPPKRGKSPPSFRVGGPPITIDHHKENAIATDDARINDRIRARQVRLIGADGSQLGVKPLPEALNVARESGLDLVEVADKADPPVCKIMDYGKYKYEQDQRRKESRRKATSVVIKEMKFRPKIDGHDYETKMKHVERFLAEGSKVKLTIMFRGREMAHPELGRRILEKVADRVAELANVEAAPRQDGRNMTMVLNPTRRPKGKGQGAAKGASKGGDTSGATEAVRTVEASAPAATQTDQPPSDTTPTTTEPAPETAPAEATA
jgi:translation initiation factor IF-3